MDLGFSEEQTMLRDVTRKLCTEMMPFSVLREHENGEPGFSSEFWRSLGELGLTGIAIDERFGGLGLGAIESAIVSEELGRALAVSPYHCSSVLAAGLIAEAATADQKSRWLGSIASGDCTFSIASSEQGSSAGKRGVHLEARACGDYVLLSGEKFLVPFASAVDALIVLARMESANGAIVAVGLDKASLEGGLADGSLKMLYQANHAGDPLYKIEFRGLRVDRAQLLAGQQCVWPCWERAMGQTLISLASYATGAAQRVHEMAVEYAKYRRAFGRAIGGFQSIAHYLADSAVTIEGARTLVYQAAWFKDEGRDYLPQAAMAKLQACDVFRRCAAVAMQVHGGLGYTVEADPQLFYRRAKQLELMHWGPAVLEQRIAADLFPLPEQA